MADEEIPVKKAGMAGVWKSIRALEERQSALEGGHSNENTHEDLLECPECHLYSSRAQLPTHLKDHYKKAESKEPKVIIHKFKWGIGFCDNPGCQKIETRDFPQVVAHLPDLLKEIKAKSDAGYECRNCHLPIVDPRATERCPMCDNPQAIKRKKPKA